ncbi:hypothetical protein SAMN04489860_0332 [Paraoerskovia marina]|uniref:Uncharacterized protein n=1 Tax=Paraoerskovia marina TaxID=545619 RepID=A0A1H1MVP4_9CELL|nr:hypothetical protein SAMN04489860_0332 [Paraoerskovia marina]
MRVLPTAHARLVAGIGPAGSPPRQARTTGAGRPENRLAPRDAAGIASESWPLDGPETAITTRSRRMGSTAGREVAAAACFAPALARAALS